MSVKRFQARMGYALIAVFAVGLVMVNARAPEPVEMNETVLGNIVRDSQTEFKAGFGGFPNLVPDRGGEPPQPLAAVTSQRGAHYRSEAWLLAQPITGTPFSWGCFLPNVRQRHLFVIMVAPMICAILSCWRCPIPPWAW